MSAIRTKSSLRRLECRLRRLLDALPHQASIRKLFIKFTIVQTGNYKPFLQQCLSNTMNPNYKPEPMQESCILKSKSQRRYNFNRVTGNLSDDNIPNNIFNEALSWSKFSKVRFVVATFLYLNSIIKYRVLGLLNYDSAFMKRLQYLDCYIPGRFRFVGRTNKISGEIASIFLLSFLIYHWSIHLLVPKFKFFALEFLMSEHDEVSSREHEANRDGVLNCHSPSKQTLKSRRSVSISVKGRRFDTISQRQQQGPLVAGPRQSPGGPPLGLNPIFYLRNPFDSNDSKWILRPNRTGDSSIHHTS